MLLARSQMVFASLFLSTGAALLIYIISGVSLSAALTLMFAGAVLIGALLWRRASAADKVELRRAIRAGVLSGLLATGAYDLARYVLVEVAGFTYWPFDVFTIFGQALLGARSGGLPVTTAGIAYHLANGVGFALAYTIWLGRRGVWTGIAWAMALEALMVSIYPGWLDLQALDEFLQVSILGHVAYGSVLGYSARRLLRQCKGADDDAR